jgi:putative transposase
VKHGLVKAPKDWEYLSFHRYVAQGKFLPDWGAMERVVFDALIGHE